MTKFSRPAFIKLDDVRAGPIRQLIAGVELGKYEKPDLVFASGDKLSLNATNNRTLIRAYGRDSEAWVGKEIELFVGEVEFQGRPLEAVLVQPISPPLKTSEQTMPPAEKAAGMDNLPF